MARLRWPWELSTLPFLVGLAAVVARGAHAIVVAQTPGSGG